LKKDLATNILPNEYLSDRYFEDNNGMNSLYSNLYVVRNKSESCVLTRIYGEKLNFVFNIAIDYSEHSIEEFIESSTRKNVLQVLKNKD